MTLYFLFNLILLLVIFIIISYLLTRLINWFIKFRKWEKGLLIEYEDSINEVAKREENTSLLPDFVVTTLQNEEVKVRSLIDNNPLLIFLDHSCMFCNSNFESLYQLLNNYKENNLLVFFQTEDREKAIEFSDLYNDSLKVYLVDKEMFSALNLRFLPAYIRLDNSYKIKFSTPIPLQALTNI